MSEVWTAESKTDDLIAFSVRDETTGEVRTEERYPEGLALMFATAGYPASVGVLVASPHHPCVFRKDGDTICLSIEMEAGQ